MTRYDWWGYVKGMIRRYPALSEAHREALNQKVTPAYSGEIGGSEAQRTTENTVLKGMSQTNEKEYEAVTKAIEQTKAKDNGDLRLKVVDFIFWRNAGTLADAAYKVHVSEVTARRYHKEFIYAVAHYYGLLK